MTMTVACTYDWNATAPGKWFHIIKHRTHSCFSKFWQRASNKGQMQSQKCDKINKALSPILTVNFSDFLDAMWKVSYLLEIFLHITDKWRYSLMAIGSNELNTYGISIILTWKMVSANTCLLTFDNLYAAVAAQGS